MTDHKANAQDWLRLADEHTDWVIDSPDRVVDRYLFAAQAEATLYLAEQQRIANLIAVATWNEQALNAGNARRYGVERIDESSERIAVDRMFAEVREGLGIA